MAKFITQEIKADKRVEIAKKFGVKSQKKIKEPKEENHKVRGKVVKGELYRNYWMAT